MSFRLLHSLKALRAIDVTVLGKVIETILVQPSKEEPPIEVNPFERMTEVRLVQSSNTELPIEVTVLGIDKEVILLH